MLCAALSVVLVTGGCQTVNESSDQQAGIKHLLSGESSNEAAIRKAAIEDRSFPTAAQPIPKRS
ncbi:MAG: hypothetical protein WBF93_03115 [Pirellulales bacterium]